MELKPRFKLPCCITLQKDYLKMYECEKLVLKGFLSGKRGLFNYRYVDIYSKFELHMCYHSLDR
jgi:hypothetical protein